MNSTPTNTARTELHIMSHFITRTRVAQDHGLHIFAFPKQLSSTCHVSFLAALDTDQKHKFSPISSTSPVFPTVSPSQTSTMNLNPYTPCDGPRQSDGSTQIPSFTGQEPKSVEFKDIEAIVPEDLEPRSIELDRNIGTDPYQIQERFVRKSLTEDMDELRKVGAGVSYFQSQMHSEYDPAESIADSDLEDGELRIMLASPPSLQNREDFESSRMPIAPGKPAALFSFGSEEPGNQLKNSIVKNADPSNLGRSLLEGNLDNLLSQAKSELTRQEHQDGSLNNCISKLQQKACATDWNYRTLNTDILNLDDNKFVHKRNYL